MTRRGERGIWQRRYWEHTIRDDRDFALHMDYTQFNPVKHGLVEYPSDWPYSLFRRCVAGGVYPAGWMMAASHKRRASGDETDVARAKQSKADQRRAFGIFARGASVAGTRWQRVEGGTRSAFPRYACYNTAAQCYNTMRAITHRPCYV